MIELKVEDKCQNCPNFSPTVDVIDISKLEDKEKCLMQTVYCKNKDFCKNMENYLRNKEK